MKKPMTAAKLHKTPKAKTRSLKVRTSVKAGGVFQNRCEILCRKV